MLHSSKIYGYQLPSQTPFWHRVLGLLRRVLMALAAFFGLSSFLTGEWIGGVEFVAALAILRFVVQPWQLQHGWKVEAWSFYALAVVLSVAAGIQYAWNLPVAEARYAAERKISDQRAAQEASQIESHYHLVIAADVFRPLPPKAGYWSQLSSQWAHVNEYRIKAAKAAIDRKQCDKVSSSNVLKPEPLIFRVSCENGGQFAFDVQAIDNGSNGNALTAFEEKANGTDAPDQTDHPIRADDLDLATSQVASKMIMEQVLLDAGSAEYQNVLAHHARANGVSFFAFCGTVRSKNIAGGYSSYQRFVATPWVATTEGGAVGFDEIWGTYCRGPSSSVWF